MCFSVCDLYTVVINKMKLSAFAAFAHPLLTLFYSIADRVIRGWKCYVQMPVTRIKLYNHGNDFP